MLTVRAPITVLLLTVAISLALIAPASAGGPTSAILSVPGEGKTASVYYTDAAYTELARLVGAEGMEVPGKIDDTGQSHESGPGVTVTWLIHDVQPWRVDRIYLNGWVHNLQVSGQVVNFLTRHLGFRSRPRRSWRRSDCGSARPSPSTPRPATSR